MATERLFVAIAFPAALREELAACFDKIRGVAWTRPEQLHLTLRFLGDTEGAVCERVEAALSAIQVEPFVLPIGGVGAFPPRGEPRVLWVGTGAGHPRLHQLRQRVDDAMLAAGIALETRLFQPHATLGRVARDASLPAIAQFLRRHRELEAAPIRVNAFGLYASELRPFGAVHTLKREFALRARA